MEINYDFACFVVELNTVCRSYAWQLFTQTYQPSRLHCFSKRAQCTTKRVLLKFISIRES